MKFAPKTLSQRPALLMAAALVLALGGGLTQTAFASPQGGHGIGAGHGGHGGHGAMMGNPRQMERMLDGINASPEQRSQIRQIMQTAATEMKAEREAGRALHEQARQLFTQPNVDARAAEAVRQQMLARHDQASKRTMQLMLDVSRVLTPEQRQQIAERMSQRRTMAERHRNERNSLEKAPR
ncbi:MAG: periplasmic heavy metal sensor [Rubrivivax sp.]|nr:periplasmic heavy metal sensor [Rubrivivax sp.]